MDEQKIFDIRLMNRFLSEGMHIVERPVYNEIKRSVKGGMIVILKGLRRTGKSTLLKYYLLSKKPDVFYYSFDEENYPTKKELNSIITYALSMDKHIIGLDEIQKIDGWAGVIKKYYDHANVQFILSGSSSLDVTAGSESLAGRMVDIKIDPLTFNEYTLFKRFPYLDEYLSTGFPELLIKSINPRYYILSIIDKVTNNDIPKIFNIRKPQIFNELTKILAERNTCLIDYRDIASDLEISKDTVKEYINILEKSFLVNLIPVYSKKVATSTRRLKKIMFAFPSLANALSEQSKGAVYENVVYHHIQRYGKVYFWREKYKEVDFILVKGKRIIPIEVKSGDVSKGDLRHIIKFMERFHVNKGIIVSKKTLDIYRFNNGKNEIKIIPFVSFITNMEKWLTK